MRASHSPGSRSQHPCDVLELGRDAGEARLREADRDREKADDIGDDDRGRRSRQHEAQLLMTERLRQRVEALVHEHQRCRQPQRQHRAGHGIADAADAHAGGDQRSLEVPQRGDRQKAEHQRDGGRGRGEHDRGERMTGKARIQSHEQAAQDRLAQQITGRQQEAQHDGREAGEGREPPRRACQHHPRGASHILNRGARNPAPRRPLRSSAMTAATITSIRQAI